MGSDLQPPVPEGWLTLGQLKAELQSILWPQGEPSNLVTSHSQMYVEALIDLQMYCEPLKLNNTSIIPWCSTYFQCGQTVVDCPRGIIRRVSTYDSISTKDHYPDGASIIPVGSLYSGSVYLPTITPGTRYYYSDPNDNGSAISLQNGNPLIIVPNNTTFIAGPDGFTILNGIGDSLITASIQPVDDSKPGREDDNAPVNWCSEVPYTNVRYIMLKKYVDKALIYLNYPSGCFGCGIGLLLPAIAPVVAIFQQYATCSKQPSTLYTEPDDASFPPLPLGFHYAQKVTDAPNRAWQGVWANERGRLYLAPWIQSSEVIVVEWDGLKLVWQDPDLIDNDPLIKKAISSYIRWKRFERHTEGPADVNYQQIYKDDLADLIWRYHEENRRRKIEDSHARSANVTIAGLGTTSSTTTLSTTTVTTTSTSTSSTSTSTTTLSTTSTTTLSTTTVSTTTVTTTSTAGEVILGTVTPDITGDQICFGSFPAGNYKVKYLSGAFKATAGGNFRLNQVSPEIFMRVIWSNGSNNSKYSPGLDSFNSGTLSTVVTHFTGTYLAFAHAGGAICMQLKALNYSGFVSGTPNATFQLYRVYP